MSPAWLSMLSILLAVSRPVACGERWLAPALQPTQTHTWGFHAEQGQSVVFETFADSTWPRPVNVQARLLDVATSTTIAANDDKAFGDLHVCLRACIVSTGDYAVLVDVPDGSLGGRYVATLSCTAADRRHDDCADAGVSSCGPVIWDGSSPCLGNDFDPGSGGCTGYAANGGDAVLGLQVDAGWTLDVRLRSTADAVLYLVSDCDDVAGSCVAGADRGLAGEPEVLRYRFDTPGRWFLVLDHHGGGQGELHLSGDLLCDDVAVRPITWSRLRRLYRE